MAGLARTVQQDFSGGSFLPDTGLVNADGTFPLPSTNPDSIPANAVQQIINGLIDDNGGIYRRGGSTYLSGGTWPGSQILWVWEGALAAGSPIILFATASNLYRLSLGVVSTIGGYVGMSGGARQVAVLNGTMFLPGGNKTYDGTTFTTGTPTADYFATVANRLVAGLGQTVSFSVVGDPTTFNSTDFWLIPGGATITGLAAVRDSCVVFTDQGTYVISNMALNLTDADGNVQQRLDLYAPDLELVGLGGPGVAGYAGGLIVPGRDGVWLMQLGVTSEVAAPLTLLSRAITPYWKLLTRRGYRPGQASVFHGHYFLPMLDSSGHLGEVLVCKLDGTDRRGRRVFAWTQLDFFAGGGPYAFETSSDGLSLFGGIRLDLASKSRLATLDYFTPALGTADADTSDTVNNVFRVAMRGVASGQLSRNVVVKARSTYRLHAAPDPATIAVSYVTDSEAGTSDALPETGDITSTAVSTIGKRCRWVQPLLEITPQALVQLNAVEVFTRPSGRV